MGMLDRVFSTFLRRNESERGEQPNIFRAENLEAFDLATWQATGEESVDDLHIQHPWAAEFDLANKAELSRVASR